MVRNTKIFRIVNACYSDGVLLSLRTWALGYFKGKAVFCCLGFEITELRGFKVRGLGPRDLGLTPVQGSRSLQFWDLGLRPLRQTPTPKPKPKLTPLNLVSPNLHSGIPYTLTIVQ